MRKLVFPGILVAALAACDTPTGVPLEHRLEAPLARRLERVLQSNVDGAHWALERLVVRQAEGSPYTGLVLGSGDALEFYTVPAGERYDFRTGRVEFHPTEFYLRHASMEPAQAVAAAEAALAQERAVKRAYEE